VPPKGLGDAIGKREQRTPGRAAVSACAGQKKLGACNTGERDGAITAREDVLEAESSRELRRVRERAGGELMEADECVGCEVGEADDGTVSRAKVDERTKSAKPPRTRKGASLFLRGYSFSKEGTATVAAIRVSLPTFPQVSLTPHVFVLSRANSSMISESRSIPPDAAG